MTAVEKRPRSGAPCRAREAGLSAVELMLGVALMVAALGVFGPLLTSSFGSTPRLQDESRALDELRVALARIDHELRSAECIDAPGAGEAGSTLTFRTHAGTAGAYDVTYSVSDGHLERRVGSVTEAVGDGVVATGTEFRHTAVPGNRALVDVGLQVRFEDDHSPRVVETTITGRNTWVPCS